MTLLENKINACREAIQKVMARQEKLVALQKMQASQEIRWEDVQDDHIRLDTDPFYSNKEEWEGDIL